MKLALLVVLALTAVVLAAGCGGSDDDTAGDTTTVTTETTETTETADTTDTTDTETETTETTETTTETTTGEGTGDAAAGETVFATAGCGSCHTLAAAGTSGSVGPNLDDASPSFDKVVERVTSGKGAMPSFTDQLSAEEIQDVAAYVSSSTSS